MARNPADHDGLLRQLAEQFWQRYAGLPQPVVVIGIGDSPFWILQTVALLHQDFTFFSLPLSGMGAGRPLQPGQILAEQIQLGWGYPTAEIWLDYLHQQGSTVSAQAIVQGIPAITKADYLLFVDCTRFGGTLKWASTVTMAALGWQQQYGMLAFCEEEEIVGAHNIGIGAYDQAFRDFLLNSENFGTRAVARAPWRPQDGQVVPPAPGFHQGEEQARDVALVQYRALFP